MSVLEANKVNEAVIRFARQIGELDDSVTITESSNIAEDLGIDSLARIDFVVLLEKHFGVVFDEKDLVDVVTIGDVAAVTEKTIKS